MRPIDAAQVATAMQKSLPPEARVEIVEVSRSPVPDGSIEFPLEGLQGKIWRGVVRYGESGRFGVWARVRVLAKQTRLMTTVPLRTGAMITANDVRVEEFEGAPLTGLVQSVEEAAGMISKRTLPAGAYLMHQFLERPAAVLKGDTVRLRATVGVAHVVTEASAQAAGKIGDIIPVKNATSGRILRARIEGPGEVRFMQ
jgi:flagella basal body P-ring formation protein FlgA